MEIGIEAELNERFTALLIIGSISSIQQRKREAGTGSREHDLAAIFFTRPESSSSEVGENSHVIMASLINGKAGASVVDSVSSDA